MSGDAAESERPQTPGDRDRVTTGFCTTERYSAVISTSRLGHRPALDGIRALAVLTVVTGHSWHILPSAWVGVEAFFVLSGFLITTLLVDEHRAIGTVRLFVFYGRRARRLLPPLAVAIPLALGIAALFDRSALALTTGEAVSSAVYATNLVEGFRADHGLVNGLLAHTWSLSVEEQFYLCWPVVLCVLLRFGRRLAMYVALLGAIAITLHRVTDVPVYEHAYFWPQYNADALLLGCAVALAVSLGVLRPSRRWVPLALPALAMLGAIAFGYTGAAYAGGWEALAAVAAALLILATLNGCPVLTWRPLVAVGRISYGIYLFHYPIVVAVGDRMGTSGPLTLALGLPLTLGVAALSYRLVEQPLLRRRAASVGTRLAVAA